MSNQKRLVRDITDLKAAGFLVLFDNNSEEMPATIESLQTILQGPKDTPYEKGSWHIQFTFANNYPFSSPSVGFVEHILHPNVDWASGSICLDALNKKWTPVFTLKHIMESLLPYLLTYPNPSDPLNREAAVLMNENNAAYLSKVLEATQRYATKK